jgi:2-polyprenyl-6-methoxyphenol hydroxylase-like FAD-dependent oxidoreductase
MHTTIVGAGIAGLALATGLRSIGFDVDVFEQAPELKPVGAGIALTTNGLRALQSIGLDDAVIARGHEILRISVLDQCAEVLETTDHKSLSARFGHVSAIAVHRSALHEALLSNLPRSVVHTGKRCTGAREDADQVKVLFDGGEEVRTDLLFACDGIHSAIRGSLYPKWRERFAKYTCWRGIAPIQPESMAQGHITESWGRGQRFGIVPLGDGHVYWFACLSADAPRDPRLASVKLQELRALFSDFHSPVREILNATADDHVICNDIFDVYPEHPYTRNRVVLLGDAAHAVTPDLGQGACQALEDAAVLSGLLAHYPFARAFARFDSERIPRTRNLVRQSRRFARIAQLNNPLAVWLRNAVIRGIPSSVRERWIDSILDVRFEAIPALRDNNQRAH